MKLDLLPPKFWIVGTDTGVGKSLVSALLTKALATHYWKPIQAGLAEETDTQFVERLTLLEADHFLEERYRLTEPLSPHAAARRDGIRMDLADFQLPETDRLIIEGAGGLLVPLNERHLLIDLIQQTNLPVLLVARSGLGTINHTLMSLEQLRSRGIEILGVALSGPLNPGNKESIEHYGHTTVLFEVDRQERITPEVLSQLTQSLFEL